MIFYSHDIELLILAKIINRPEVMHDISDTFYPSHFHGYEELAYTVLKLHNAKHPITAITIENILKESTQLIEQLEFRAEPSIGIERDLLFIHELYLKRQAILSASKLREDIERGKDVFECLESAEAQINGITAHLSGNSIQSTDELVKEFYIHQKNIIANQGVSGILTGLKSIDSVLRGIKAPDFIIIGGRPAMGKSALVVSMARNIAITYNYKVGIFTLEMSSLQLLTRIISSESGIASDDIFNGLNQYQLDSAKYSIDSIAKTNIYFDETAGLTLNQFKQKANRMVKRMGVNIIIIDYLQLMDSSKKGNNRENDISEISRGIKKIAKELNIPIIALSQLSREVEKRADRVPILSDLRESGAIEQDADIVGFLYRPEYYGIKEDQHGKSTDGMGYLIIAKHRNGKLGWCPMRFTASLTKFDNVY